MEKLFKQLLEERHLLLTAIAAENTKREEKDERLIDEREMELAACEECLDKVDRRLNEIHAEQLRDAHNFN